MQDILQQIVATKREEVAALHTTTPLPSRGEAGGGVCNLPSLREALLQSDTGIIAEFKRRSPSKGWIKEDGRADVIPDDFIRIARQSGVTLPILYKNFVIDEAQLYAAVLCGASAVLLIAACLTKPQCKSLMEKAHALGLEVLLEMHTEHELEYADLGPDLCGINNRNLGSFVTDVENSFRLAELLPKDAVKVSESGISSPQTIRELRQAGFRGFLIGETFMKAPDPGQTLKQFIEQI